MMGYFNFKNRLTPFVAKLLNWAVINDAKMVAKVAYYIVSNSFH